MVRTSGAGKRHDVSMLVSRSQCYARPEILYKRVQLEEDKQQHEHRSITTPKATEWLNT